MRQLFWWVGTRPASRSSIAQILKSGKSVALVPGGVRETHHMEPGKEVLFLKQRMGFVRLAIQQGSPLLPVFAFNQTQTYTRTASVSIFFSCTNDTPGALGLDFLSDYWISLRGASAYSP